MSERRRAAMGHAHCCETQQPRLPAKRTARFRHRRPARRVAAGGEVTLAGRHDSLAVIGIPEATAEGRRPAGLGGAAVRRLEDASVDGDPASNLEHRQGEKPMAALFRNCIATVTSSPSAIPSRMGISPQATDRTAVSPPACTAADRQNQESPPNPQLPANVRPDGSSAPDAPAHRAVHRPA